MCSVKRENNNIVLSNKNIILDIEGTTTSISFVKDVLFPYVRKNLKTYVDENWDSEDFKAIVNALRLQANEDKEKKIEGVVDIPVECEKDDMIQALIDNVLWQMDLDRKTKCLKDLQGLIMEAGYKKGEIKGHVYDDVEPNLKLWKELGKAIYIYSSGSIHAQKLLYGHSEKGDLLQYINGHFDTTVGNKGDTESYKQIIEQISGIPSEAVFFTDIPKEAKAAKDAELLAVLLSRDGNAPLTDDDKKEFQVISSFSEVQFENTPKKRKVCTENDDKSENKLVESYEASITTLKEPTNSILTQQPDVQMEVEESPTEENVCDSKCDEKLASGNVEDKITEQNGSSENTDVEMKPTVEVKEEDPKKPQERDNGVEQANGIDEVEEQAPQEEKVEVKNNEQHDLSNKLNGDESHELLSKNQEKAENAADEKSNSLGDNTNTATNDSQSPKEKKCVNEIKEPSQEVSEENKKFVSDQAQTENKCEPSSVVKENGCDTEMKKELSPKSTINGEGKNESELKNNSLSHTKEIDQSNGEKLLESNPPSKSESGNIEATDLPESDMEVGEICTKGSKNSDNDMSNTTPPQSVPLNNQNSETNKLKNKDLEKPEVIKIVSTTTTDEKTPQNTSISETETENDAILKCSLPADQSNKIIPELNTEMEVTVTKSDDDHTNSQPCIETSEDTCKTQQVDVPNANENKSGEMEIDEVKIETGKEASKITKEVTLDNELCNATEGESKINGSVSELNTKMEIEADTTESSETKNQSDEMKCSQQTNGELSEEGKNQIKKLSQITDEKEEKDSDGHRNGKEAVSDAILENGTKDDVSQLDKEEETTKAVNGKVHDESKSIDCNDEEDLVKETSVCEVKKCEVPEDAVIAAVVEA